MVITIPFTDKKIGQGQPVFVIAEIGINHNGDMELAKKLIVQAKKSGADAVKFQTYITERRVKKESPIYSILKKCELNPGQTRELNDFCKSNEIIFFSTPFDKESADLLFSLEVPLIKVASFDVVNRDLLRHISRDTPIIISRGMTSKEEIDTAVAIFKANRTPYAILHCISSYPTEEKDANLNVISALQKSYGCPVGFSDHTLGIKVPVYSVLAGAQIIEKHFTLDKDMEGPDHKLSCDPVSMANMVAEIRRAEIILGNSEIKQQHCERDIVQYRRPSV